MEEQRKEVGVKEFQEEAGEQSIKVGWKRGLNGMREKSETEADMGGLCQGRFGSSGRGVESNSEGWGE